MVLVSHISEAVPILRAYYSALVHAIVVEIPFSSVARSFAFRFHELVKSVDWGAVPAAPPTEQI